MPDQHTEQPQPKQARLHLRRFALIVSGALAMALFLPSTIFASQVSTPSGHDYCFIGDCELPAVQFPNNPNFGNGNAGGFSGDDRGLDSLFGDGDVTLNSNIIFDYFNPQSGNGGDGSGNDGPAPTPEPGTLALLAAGLLGLVSIVHYRKFRAEVSQHCLRRQR